MLRCVKCRKDLVVLLCEKLFRRVGVRITPSQIAVAVPLAHFRAFQLALNNVPNTVCSHDLKTHLKFLYAPNRVGICSTKLGARPAVASFDATASSSLFVITGPNSRQFSRPKFSYRNAHTTSNGRNDDCGRESFFR